MFMLQPDDNTQYHQKPNLLLEHWIIRGICVLWKSLQFYFLLWKILRHYGIPAKASTWRSWYISLWTKLKMLNPNVKSVLLYGSKPWRLTSSIIKKLNRRHRYILHIFSPNRKASDNLWQSTEQEKIKVITRWRKWRWIRDTLRKPTNNTMWQALEWNPQGKRKKGRPKKSWRTSRDRYDMGAD